MSNNKNASKTLIKLPRLNGSSSKSPLKLQKKPSVNKDYDYALTAQAYGIYDAELRPIAEFNTNEKRQIASLTKMMSLLCSVKLCRKFKVNMNKCYFRVTANAAGTRGTSAELESKEWATIQSLLYGMMLPSGNDAATVLSENFGAFIYYDRLGEAALLNGNNFLMQDLTDDTWNVKIYTEQFVKFMNSTAKDLNMKETFYINPHGLDSSFRLESYSIAEDMAILTKALIDYQECWNVITKNQYTAELKTISGKEVEIRKMTWQNTNKLLGEQGFLAGKTGQTQFAGNCLASIYENKRKERFFVIILGCSTKEARFRETKLIVDKHLRE